MPSTSKKQARMMAAVAHNPRFAKKVGIPQSVGRDFNQADQKLGKLKRKYAKGGFIKPGLEAVRGMDIQSITRRMSEIKARVDAGEKTPELIDEYSALQSRLKQMTEKPTPAASRGQAVNTLDNLIQKYQPAPAAASPPEHLDPSTGQPLKGHGDVLEAVRSAIEEESDEPDWVTAASLLQKVPNSASAQSALGRLHGAYNSPNHAEFDQAMHDWMRVFDELKKGQTTEGLGGPPPAMAKGGQVNMGLIKLKKAIGSATIPPPIPPVKKPKPPVDRSNWVAPASDYKPIG